MTTQQIVERLLQACQQAGGIKAWAVAHSVSPQYVGDVIHGRRNPSTAILGPLGLVRVVDYQEANAE